MNLMVNYFRFIECRQNCAYNFPAMTKFSVSNPELLDKIYPSFCDFTTDPYYMVRKTIGAGMHEVLSFATAMKAISEISMTIAQKKNSVVTKFF